MQARMLNNRYELLDVLGQGGMATVYRGRDTRLGRPVAIKLLHSQYVGDNQFLQRFEHEAQAAAGLSAHPNIVDVYDVGQDNGVPYIVMELVEGRDLSTLIEQEGPLPVDRTIHIAEQAADALDYAHQRGFVHRDVKPQNIMVGPNDEVKITDFGIAKSALSTAVTQAGMTFGTADYISPEQAQGITATAQSDIYGLGIVVYEMLTKHLPFTGDSPMAVALQQIQNTPPPLSQWNPTLPPNLERIVLTALAKDPRQRPASAKAFATMLREYRSARGQETQVAPVVKGPAIPPSQAATYQVPQAPRVPAHQTNTAPLPTVAPIQAGLRRVPPPVAPPPLARRPAQQGFPFGGLLLGIMILGGLLGLAYVAFATDTLQTIFGSVVAPTTVAQPTAVSATAVSSTAATTSTPIVLIQITDFVGRPEAEVRNALVNAGLVPDLPDPARTDPVYDRGIVVEQRPPAGTTVHKGDKIYLRISLGKQTAVVPPTPVPTSAPTLPSLIALPDLSNQSGDTVLTALTQAGFRVNPIRQPSTSVAAGQVISQSPAPGTYPPDTVITVTISQGDVIKFPPLIGTDLAQATQIIQATPNLSLTAVDLQGPDRLPNYNRYRPNQVVSATADGRAVVNGDLVSRTAQIVLGVRKP